VAEELTGPDLDIAIAERVMGLIPCTSLQHDHSAENPLPLPCHGTHEAPDSGDQTPRYSESIEAAMQVVEKFIDMGGRVSMRGMRFVAEGFADEYKPGWRVNFYRFQRDAPAGTKFSFDAESESLPEAICLAALDAVGSKPE
jgi:hypothetical protein